MQTAGVFEARMHSSLASLCYRQTTNQGRHGDILVKPFKHPGCVVLLPHAADLAHDDDFRRRLVR